jgi:hypothetical protein
MMTAELFPESRATERPATRAPEELNPAQLKLLHLWAEQRVPWVTRGALESLTPIEDHTDACLNYFSGKKTMRANWVGTIKNWIRRDERSRLERLAKNGNENARLALRDPSAWRKRFDRIDKVLAHQPPPGELIIPKESTGGAVSLSRSGGR